MWNPVQILRKKIFKKRKICRFRIFPFFSPGAARLERGFLTKDLVFSNSAHSLYVLASITLSKEDKPIGPATTAYLCLDLSQMPT